MNLVNLTKPIIALVITGLLYGCSGIEVSQDYEQGYNFSALKKFAWNPSEEAYVLDENELVDKRIRNAVVSQLKAKSYQLTDVSEADFLISYRMTVEQKISSSGVSSGISLGRGSFGGFGSIGISSGSQVRAYDQGTLSLDMNESKSGELIWRGVSTQSVSDHSSPTESTEVINETVEKVLEQFPPK